MRQRKKVIPLEWFLANPYMTVKETSEIFNCQTRTVMNAREGYGLSVKKVDATPKSKCISCQNAYALKCEWVRNGKEVWDSAETKEIAAMSGSTGFVKVVRKCKNYIPD